MEDTGIQNGSPTRSALLTPAVARLGIELASPTVVKMMTAQIGDEPLLTRKVAAIAVIDGTGNNVTNDGSMPILARAIFRGTDDGEIGVLIAENPNQYITKENEGERRFENIVMGKASISNRTGLNSLIVRELAPQCFRLGDTIYEGSWEECGIIVACSGVQSYFDAAIAGCIGETTKGLLKHKLAQIKKLDQDFLTPEVLEQVGEIEATWD